MILDSCSVCKNHERVIARRVVEGKKNQQREWLTEVWIWQLRHIHCLLLYTANRRYLLISKYGPQSGPLHCTLPTVYGLVYSRKSKFWNRKQLKESMLESPISYSIFDKLTTVSKKPRNASVWLLIQRFIGHGTHVISRIPGKMKNSALDSEIISRK